MSTHGHATPGDAVASHDHHYEGIPADRPAPDEPRTPLWLPLVGLGLLLLSLLVYAVTRPPAKTGVELAKEATPEVSAAPAPAEPPNPRVRRLPGLASVFPPSAGQPGAGQPGAAPSAAAPRPMASAGPRPFVRPTPAGGDARPRSGEPKPAPPAPAR